MEPYRVIPASPTYRYNTVHTDIEVPFNKGVRPYSLVAAATKGKLFDLAGVEFRWFEGPGHGGHIVATFRPPDLTPSTIKRVQARIGKYVAGRVEQICDLRAIHRALHEVDTWMQPSKS